MDALGIDIGSTNVKVVLVRDDGTTLAAAHRPLTWARDGEAAEQDPDAMWEAVRGALADVAAAVGPGTMAAVGAVGLCGQYSSIVPVDAAGTPVAPMRLYLDQRGTAHCFAILGRHEEAFLTWVDRHPIPPVGGGLALGHLLAFQLDEPAVHERTAAYLEPVDFITARLTGTITATQGTMFMSQLIDNRTLGATEYDAELIAMAGVDPSRLPPLVEVGSVVGTVLPDIAEALGLASDVPVVTGMTDSCAGAHATGAEVPGRVGIAIGTTGVVLSSVDALGVDLDHEVLAMPGLRTDRYLVSAENGIAGRAVEHVLTHLIHADDALGDHGSADPFAGFDEALGASPAGARGGPLPPVAVRVDVTAGRCRDARRVRRRLARQPSGRPGASHRRGRGPQPALAARPGRRLHRPDHRRDRPHRRRRPVCGLVADPGRRPRAPRAHPAGARSLGRTGVAAGWALEQLGHGGGEWVRLDRSFEPDASTSDVHAHAQAQFTAAFEALRPLRLGTVAPG